MSRTAWPVALLALLAVSCGGPDAHDSTPAGAAPTVLETGELGAAAATADVQASGERGVVRFVPDGDTILLRDGRTVRLVQIDAPEHYPPEREECYGDEARARLRGLAPPGTRIVLRPDPALDDHDQYGRLLRYVLVGGRNVNLVLVRDGAAAPYFFRGERGRHASRLERDARRARARRLGLWGACPAARLNPKRALDTGPAGQRIGRLADQPL
jgi:micrococcal nuclease